MHFSEKKVTDQENLYLAHKAMLCEAAFQNFRKFSIIKTRASGTMINDLIINKLWKLSPLVHSTSDSINPASPTKAR